MKENMSAKKQQKKVMLIVIAVVVVAGAALAFDHNKRPGTSAPKSVTPPVNLTGVTSTDFNQKVTQQALNSQQQQTHSLSQQVSDLAKSMQALTTQVTTLKAQNGQLKEQLEQGSSSKSTSTTPPPSNLKNGPVSITSGYTHGGMDGTSSLAGDGGVQQGIQSVSFAYATPAPKNPLLNHYVPSGTFVKGVLLEGADANASVSGQQDQSMTLIRLTGQAVLPNDQTLDLKGCVITAGVYGDISSERGIFRLGSLSCTLADHLIVDTKVQGSVAFAGKAGVKGRPIMRNGKIIAWAGLSGALSGIGSALQQSQSTQSISPLGTTSTVNGSQVFKSGLAGGAGTALNTLSQYYIKRADQYHPVIEIGSDNTVTVIFEHGFYLTPVEKKTKSANDKGLIQGGVEKAEATDTGSLQVPDNVLQQIKTAHLGQNLSFEPTSIATEAHS